MSVMHFSLRLSDLEMTGMMKHVHSLLYPTQLACLTCILNHAWLRRTLEHAVCVLVIF